LEGGQPSVPSADRYDPRWALSAPQRGGRRKRARTVAALPYDNAADLQESFVTTIWTERAELEERCRADGSGTARGATRAIPMHRPYGLKWPLEAALALLGLVLLLPVCLIVALAIWLEDRGPVFVHQVRVGRLGIPFGVIKFRTMRPQDPAGVHRQATANDSRITRVGRVLRATALDEIPQLLNVIRGDMSFVGPRALLPREIEVDPRSRYHGIEDVPNYHVRISVRPGLTGLAQVYAPRDISRQRKFKYDALYVRKMSLGLDVRLILVSIFISLTGRWPRRGRPRWQRSSG
jgi:lipopolysaccharide/colanic/teichoic acid biosynthesis glycosyltransferase